MKLIKLLIFVVVIAYIASWYLYVSAQHRLHLSVAKSCFGDAEQIDFNGVNSIQNALPYVEIEQQVKADGGMIDRYVVLSVAIPIAPFVLYHKVSVANDNADIKCQFSGVQQKFGDLMNRYVKH